MCIDKLLTSDGSNVFKTGKYGNNIKSNLLFNLFSQLVQSMRFVIGNRSTDKTQIPGSRAVDKK